MEWRSALTNNQLHTVWTFICVITGIVYAPHVRAQEDQKTATPPSAQLSLEQVESRLESLAKATDLDEATRRRQTQLLTEAIKSLQTERKLLADIKRLTESVATAEEDLKTLQSKLGETASEQVVPENGLELAAAQQRLADRETELLKLEKELAALNVEINRRAARRAEIPQRLSEIQAEIQKRGTVSDLPETGEDTAVLWQARSRALKAEMAFLEQELPAYNATDPVLLAQRDVVAGRIVRLKRTVDMWREFTAELRRSEAEKFQRQAERRVSEVHESVRPLAEQVAKLAKQLVSERKKLGDQIAKVESTTRDMQLQRLQLKREYDELTARAEAVGFTNSVGLLLRRQRSSLPDLSELDRNLAARQSLIGKTHVKRIEYQHQRPVADQLEMEVEKYLEKAKPDGNAATEVADDFRQILRDRSQYLDGVISDLGNVIDKLTLLDGEERLLFSQTQEQSAYIAEHVLWVRGSAPISRETPQEVWAAWEWTTRTLGVALSNLARDARKYTLLWCSAALCLIVFIVLRFRHRSVMSGLADIAARRSTTSMRPTLLAALLTTIFAAVGPLVFLFLSWRLQLTEDASSATRAVAKALTSTAALWLLFDALRRLCRPKGLAGAHFEWPARSIDSFRAMVYAAMWFCVPLSFLVVLTGRSGNDLFYASLGRLALVGALAGFSWRQYRLLRPNGRVMTEATAAAPDSWFVRLRYLYPLSVLIPLGLAGLALSGYLFAAEQLSIRLVKTVWIGAGTLVVIALLRRWQRLTYRALAMQQARDRRTALLQEAEEKGNVAEVEVATATFEEEAATLSDSNQQTRKLIGWVCTIVALVGVAWLWSDVLPALNSVQNMKLWKNSLADSTASELERWVKLGDVGLAVALVLLTIGCARNIPGVLEFAVLQRLPLDAGSRYAISNVFRYCLVVIGAVVAFRFIGIGWANVQWLVAAITVGLGFGLQEIFANFVSGLILLFERPIRVGDTITVGNITGTVTKIRIRATTIIDWDRKELVVPNREFVTGQLVNWTLTDQVLRVVIEVGIAYGSDTELATKLLYEVARANADVLDEPPPRVVFHSFGDSTLDFRLKIFVNTLTKFVTIRHSINTEIDKAFRRNNIEIAFPQRDLHLRTSDVELVPRSARTDLQLHQSDTPPFDS
jgi:potassium efflux system protein